MIVGNGLCWAAISNGVNCTCSFISTVEAGATCRRS
jgi:hypothetical protein